MTLRPSPLFCLALFACGGQRQAPATVVPAGAIDPARAEITFLDVPTLCPGSQIHWAQTKDGETETKQDRKTLHEKSLEEEDVRLDVVALDEAGLLRALITYLVKRVTTGAKPPEVRSVAGRTYDVERVERVEHVTSDGHDVSDEERALVSIDFRRALGSQRLWHAIPKGSLHVGDDVKTLASMIGTFIAPPGETAKKTWARLEEVRAPEDGRSHGAGGQAMGVFRMGFTLAWTSSAGTHAEEMSATLSYRSDRAFQESEGTNVVSMTKGADVTNPAVPDSVLTKSHAHFVWSLALAPGCATRVADGSP